jgi:hypothetical protein
MKKGRDNLGRFKVGNRGGPGRPKRVTETEYLRALSRIVSLEDLRAIARRAVADAKKGSAKARDWVSRYLLGDPAPPVPPRTGRRKRRVQALLDTVRAELSPEPTAAVPDGYGPSLQDPAPGSPQPANGPGAPPHSP